MNETLEQIALRVAKKSKLNELMWLDESIETFTDEVVAVTDFAQRLVAALGAQEPVAQVDMNKASCVRWLNSTDPDTFHGTKLYAAPQIPQREGWQLVPKDYTYAMKQAWLGGNSFDERYKAMLAAAPKPEDV